MGQSADYIRATLLAFCTVTVGCAGTFHERHFLKTVEHGDGQTANYFKVEVTGFSLAAQTRYVSGFFDPHAVERYFGTFSQPKDGQFPATQPSTDDKANSQTGNSKSADTKTTTLTGEKDGRLVMLLSSNSDDVVEALKSLSTNQEIAKLTVQLANSEKYKAVQAADVSVASQAGKGDHAAAVAAETIDALSDKSSEAEARTALLRLANDLASSLGHDKVLLSLDEVQVFAAELRQSGGVK